MSVLAALVDVVGALPSLIVLKMCHDTGSAFIKLSWCCRPDLTPKGYPGKDGVKE